MGAYTDATNSIAQSYRDMHAQKLAFWKMQAERQKVIDGKTFWRQCYIAALAAGKFNTEATIIADLALEKHQDKL